MITGAVNSRLEAALRLMLRGPNGQMRRVSAVIDTGFYGWLSLPNAIEELGLPWRRRGCAILADGSESVFDIYLGSVTWDRRKYAIPIDEADATPLVGTALLADYELTAEFRRRGRVTIKRLELR